jgi:hypothetical protein
VGGVVFEQIGNIIGGDEIINTNKLEIRILDTRPKNEATDTTESVDGDSYFCHEKNSFAAAISLGTIKKKQSEN